MQRVTVVGVSGSGKTTLAKILASRLNAYHIELDALYHQANWTPLDREAFVRRIEGILQQHDRWVSCGNYNQFVGNELQAKADTIVWLDLPRLLITRRVFWRSLRRFLTQEELWNGNREPVTNLYHPDPDKNIVMWAWAHYPKYRRQYLARMMDGTWDHARVVRLCRPKEVSRFIEALPASLLD